MRRKPTWFYDETFMQNFYFFLGWKPKLIENYMNKQGWLVDLGFFDGKCGYCVELSAAKNKGAIIIWTKERPKTPESFSVLAHECLHATNILFESRGVKADFGNDEAQAYMLALLIRKALG